MIRGVHTMFYSSQADQLRAFLRDTLGLPFTDVGGGWLIFDLPEAEMGVHPSDESHAHSRAGMHSISFYCDNIERTVADLKGKGVEFNNPIADRGYGLVTQFKLPGGVLVDLYQPQYTKETAPRPIGPVRSMRELAAPPGKPKPRKARTRRKKKVTVKIATTKAGRKKLGKEARKAGRGGRK